MDHTVESTAAQGVHSEARRRGYCPHDEPYAGSWCQPSAAFDALCYYGSMRCCGYSQAEKTYKCVRGSWQLTYNLCRPCPTPRPTPEPTPHPTPAPARPAQQCTTGRRGVFLCNDGIYCSSSYGCCRQHYGRAKCPLEKPYMCADRSCNNDHCCADAAFKCAGGVRQNGCGAGPAFQPQPPSGSPSMLGATVGSPAQFNSVLASTNPFFEPSCTTGKENLLLCSNNVSCNVIDDGWNCCAKNGGRAMCPLQAPYMCNDKTCYGDYCCATFPEQCKQSVRPHGCGGGPALQNPASHGPGGAELTAPASGSRAADQE